MSRNPGLKFSNHLLGCAPERLAARGVDHGHAPVLNRRRQLRRPLDLDREESAIAMDADDIRYAVRTEPDHLRPEMPDDGATLREVLADIVLFVGLRCF